MKKVLLTILISLVVGGGFAFIFYKNINEEVQIIASEENIINFFQVGVFKDESNANEYMKKFSSSIVIKDKEYYRVIVAIVKTEEAVLKMKAYFDSLGINYYVKKESISDEEFINKLIEYEKIMLAASSETYNTLNKDILKSYESRK